MSSGGSMATTFGIGLRIDRAELPDQDVLGMVGVLVFIDQHMPEASPILLAKVGKRLQQMHRRHDQIIEIQRIGR